MAPTPFSTLYASSIFSPSSLQVPNAASRMLSVVLLMPAFIFVATASTFFFRPISFSSLGLALTALSMHSCHSLTRLHTAPTLSPSSCMKSWSFPTTSFPLARAASEVSDLPSKLHSFFLSHLHFFSTAFRIFRGNLNMVPKPRGKNWASLKAFMIDLMMPLMSKKLPVALSMSSKKSWPTSKTDKVLPKQLASLPTLSLNSATSWGSSSSSSSTSSSPSSPSSPSSSPSSSSHSPSSPSSPSSPLLPRPIGAAPS
mmetsp:Transcript_135445/g.234962  ORF Transcript_135445/g.234962 Transcript_135445/m.234962 type:complete len:256 (+) Transcript_135445:1516-2283(+)